MLPPLLCWLNVYVRSRCQICRLRPFCGWTWIMFLSLWLDCLDLRWAYSLTPCSWPEGSSWLPDVDWYWSWGSLWNRHWNFGCPLFRLLWNQVNYKKVVFQSIKIWWNLLIMKIKAHPDPFYQLTEYFWTTVYFSRTGGPKYTYLDLSYESMLSWVSPLLFFRPNIHYESE